MKITFRPAIREQTPLIIGISGPTKSGKTYSAHRLARGLADGREVVMVNAEGARGHQYADLFSYVACDLVPPYRYGLYEQVLREAAGRKPGAIIVDSMSHAHDGPGGFLEWHEEELDRIAGENYEKRDKCNFTAWIKPKAAENAFRYALLEMPCPVILCMRAKEKIKIVSGRSPIDLGWQPIVGESIAFETIFNLMLPPHSKGVPDLKISDMREPFDTMVPKDKAIDEDLGRELAKWATGGVPKEATAQPSSQPASQPSRQPDGDTADGNPNDGDGPPPSNLDVQTLLGDYEQRIKAAATIREATEIANEGLDQECFEDAQRKRILDAMRGWKAAHETTQGKKR